MKTFSWGALLVSCFCLSGSASAVTVHSALHNDFEDGSSHGWKKGAGSSQDQWPTVEQEANGNHYLKINSHGKGGGRSPSSRMTFINETEWRGNFLAAGVNSVKTRMKNMGSDPLHMRIGFTTRAIEEWHFGASKDYLLLPADGQWYDLSFAITEEYITPFLGSEGSECCFPEWTFNELVAGNNQLKFHSGKEAHFWGGDRVASELWVDDIRVSDEVLQAISLSSSSPLQPDVSAVPLPAAAWLFISGITGLIGLQHRKK